MASQISLFDGSSKYVNEKPIRLIECFAGYGSQALALKYLGIPFEHHRIVEWAVKSIQAYKDMHFPNDNTDYSCGMDFNMIIDYLFDKGISADYNKPMTRDQIKRMGENKCRVVYNNIQATNNLVSVCNVKGTDLGITDTDRFTYLLTYSFPCFTGDSLVLTDQGYKKIADMAVGDMVLTHDNTYQKVLNVFDNGIHEIYSIKGMAIDEIKTTANHKFYVREMYRENARRKFKQPTWKEVSKLTRNDYLGIAINQNAIIPKWQGVQLPKTYKNDLAQYMANRDFWWLIGRYIADGWQRTQGGIIICSGKQKNRQLEKRLDRLFNYCCVEERTVFKYHIPRKELQFFVDQFGKGAKNKKINNTILDLPCDLLEEFLEGYWSADGCFSNGLYSATSISRELIYGIAQCVAKVHKAPYRIYKTIRPPTTIIEGRTVNQNDYYKLIYKKQKKKQDKAFYEDGFIWYPIKKIEKKTFEKVYDIEVDKNHSFTVQNTIVHNCQDLSNAGKRKGMDRDSGTRSGLLWEIERILKDCTELPQILVMENVPEVVGKKNKEAFGNWIKFLDGLGYHSKQEILNATEYSMPQNRKRCFMVSILGDYYYEFPQKIGCTMKLNDLLEKNVSEEYYLSENILNYFLKHSKECQEKGNGFRFEPSNGDCIAKCVTTRAGGKMDDNFIDDKVHSVVKLSHGYFPGSIERNADTSPTIDTGVGNWHTLIGEETVYGIGLNESENFRKPPMKECSRTLLVNKANCGEGVLISQCECLGMLEGGKWDNLIESSRRVYSPEKACPTLTTCGGGNQEIKIAVPSEDYEPKVIGGVGEKKSNGGTQWYQQDRIYDENCAITISTGANPYYAFKEPLAFDEQNGYLRKDGTVGTIVTDGSSPKHNNRIIEPQIIEEPLEREGWHNYAKEVISPDGACRTLSTQSNNLLTKIKEPITMRVRKLTPNEVFRLMGVKDEDYKRVAVNQSKSSLYHLAGDSIVSTCLMAILGELFDVMWKDKTQMLLQEMKH